MVKTGLPILIVGILMFLAVACASGPTARVEDYRRAISAHDAAALASLSVENGVSSISESVLEQAMQQGYVATVEDGKTSISATAEVDADGQRYLLVRQGQQWKIQCATIGPFHNYTPESTLLLARHLIRSESYDDLRALLPAELEQSKTPLDPVFIEQLQLFVDETTSALCESFQIEGDLARLRYGASKQKTLLLLRQENRWKIKELW